MSLFKKITKKVGKVLGSVAKPALQLAGHLGVPGASIVASLLPTASPKVQAAAAPLLVAAAEHKAVSPAQAMEFATNAAASLRAQGATEQQATELATAVQQAAQKAPSVALPAVVRADEAISVGSAPVSALTNSFTKEEGKAVLKGAIEGVRNGALDAYLEKTQAGQEQKAAAVDTAGSRMLPYILCGAVLFLMFNKK